jgi:hypothetical protein
MCARWLVAERVTFVDVRSHTLHGSKYNLILMVSVSPFHRPQFLHATVLPELAEVGFAVGSSLGRPSDDRGLDINGSGVFLCGDQIAGDAGNDRVVVAMGGCEANVINLTKDDVEQLNASITGGIQTSKVWALKVDPEIDSAVRTLRQRLADKLRRPSVGTSAKPH